ncbi:protein CASC10 [Nomascus leucogenys]|uniref:protein CASC10 n=1 Tax=Nomascus leucogenys TaxID=61853 RepID=UPI00122D854D|nr:protein CASC10 [Nomascus leucogenys]
MRGFGSGVQRTCRVRPGGGCTGACLADLDSGLRTALPGANASATSPTSLLETKLNALVTVLKKIQSREPSGWRTAERRRGWRCRGVPTPSGDLGPGAARPAARGGAGKTTGQQRPLQVPGASAAAAQTRLLRWHHRVPSPRAALSPGSIRRTSPWSSGPDRPERPECADACCYLLEPLTLPLIQDFRGCPASDFDRRD